MKLNLHGDQQDNNRLMGPASAASRNAIWLCVLLVSCNVIIVGQAAARALDEEPSVLPALVLSENESQPGSVVVERSSPAPVSSVAESQPATTEGAQASPAAKEAIPPQADASAKPAPEASAPEKPAEKPAEGPREQPTSQGEREGQADQPTTAAPETTTASASTTSAPQPSTTERDLKSLLENKNDAENDLAAPSTKAPEAADAPVSVVADSVAPAKANDDRFHYSLGSPASPEKSDSPSPSSGDSDDSAAEEPVKAIGERPSVELEGKKDKAEEKPAAEAAPDTKVIVDATVAAAPAAPEESAAKPADSERLEPKKDEIPSTSAPKLEEPAESTTTATAATSESAQAETSSAAPPATSTTEKPIEREETKKPLASDATESGAAENTSPASAASEPEESKPLGTTEKPTTTTGEAQAATSEPLATTTASASSSTPAPTVMVAKSDSDKPAAAEPAPGSLASAIGAAASAAGAAAGSAIGNALSGNNNKPSVAADAAPAASASGASAPSTTTTTRAPTSTRKSTTNKWNRWQPTTSVPATSSSSLPPPTRRRPILPSIRRRFRPYNRFSPFPWAGPDSYSPFDPSMGADAEPDFTLGGGPRPSPPQALPSSTLKPKRRPTTTTTASPSSSVGGSKSSTAAPAPLPGKQSPDDSSSAPDDEVTPNVLNRRRPSPSGGAGGKRRHHNHNHHRQHHHNHHHRHHYSGDLPDYSSRPYGGGPSAHRPSYHHHPAGGSRANRHDSFGSGGGGSFFEPFSPGSSFSSRPSGGSGFGLFNSAGGSPSTGSAFDLLNPFSWLDEVTKPRPSLHNRPPLSSFGSGGSPGESRPTPSHIGIPGRPSGQRPAPFEGEYNDRPALRPELDSPHDHHHDHHVHRERPHGRPSRDDYDEGYDCHGHGHDHDHEHDYHEHNHRPQRPYRPIRPGRDDYEYGHSRPIGGGRPGRPFIRSGEDSSSSSGPNVNRETESADDSPALSSGAGEPLRPQHRAHAARPPHSERHSSAESTVGSSAADEPSTGAGLLPRRVPSSMFSPFDTLFGSLDEDLFGGLRSSFVDAPLKAAADSLNRAHSAAFDAVVSSPKISLPGAAQPASGANKQNSAANTDEAAAAAEQATVAKVESSARVVVQPSVRLATAASSNPAGAQSPPAGKPQASLIVEAQASPAASTLRSTAAEGGPNSVASTSPTDVKHELREFIDRIKSLRSRRLQAALGEQPPVEPEPNGAATPNELDNESGASRIAAANSEPTLSGNFRGGIRNFLLMI